MPMDEDKQLSKGEQFLEDTEQILKKVDEKRTDGEPVIKELKIICEQCDAKGLKVGFDEEKQKDVLQNPDGSRHKKWNYPPKKNEKGKEIWTFRCTNSKDDWSKKKSDYKKPEYNADFPLSSTDLIKHIHQNSNVDGKVIGEWYKNGIENGWSALARFAGCLENCERIGNTKSAFVGMIFKVGEHQD